MSYHPAAGHGAAPPKAIGRLALALASHVQALAFDGLEEEEAVEAAEAGDCSNPSPASTSTGTSDARSSNATSAARREPSAAVLRRVNDCDVRLCYFPAVDHISCCTFSHSHNFLLSFFLGCRS